MPTHQCAVPDTVSFQRESADTGRGRGLKLHSLQQLWLTSPGFADNRVSCTLAVPFRDALFRLKPVLDLELHDDDQALPLPSHAASMLTVHSVLLQPHPEQRT